MEEEVVQGPTREATLVLQGEELYLAGLVYRFFFLFSARLPSLVFSLLFLPVLH